MTVNKVEVIIAVVHARGGAESFKQVENLENIIQKPLRAYRGRLRQQP